MTRRIALLRAINVGGSGKVAMADLRALAEELGFGRVETFIQSGNLVFDAGDTPNAEVEAGLAALLRSRLGVMTDVIVRDREGWAAMVADNPMPDAATLDPSRLLVLVLGAPATPAQIERLSAAAAGAERLVARDDVIYAALPDGIGRSKLGALLSRASGLRATGRNWNTVLKLKAMVEA